MYGGIDCVEAISGRYLTGAATVEASFNFPYILVSSLIFEQRIASPDTRAVTYGDPNHREEEGYFQGRKRG